MEYHGINSLLCQNEPINHFLDGSTGLTPAGLAELDWVGLLLLLFFITHDA